MSSPRPEAVHIDFSVEDGLEARWDEDRIAALVRVIVQRELPERAAISLHLVSEETIRALNAEHRGLDVPTDVLSFPLHASTDFVLPPDHGIHLGDVVVSYPRAVEQAHEYGHTVERELAYLVTHGVLHVLGYDHEAEDDRLRMRAKEEEALTPLGFTR